MVNFLIYTLYVVLIISQNSSHSIWFTVVVVHIIQHSQYNTSVSMNPSLFLLQSNHYFESTYDQSYNFQNYKVPKELQHLKGKTHVMNYVLWCMRQIFSLIKFRFQFFTMTFCQIHAACKYNLLVNLRNMLIIIFI